MHLCCQWFLVHKTVQTCTRINNFCMVITRIPVYSRHFFGTFLVDTTPRNTVAPPHDTCTVDLATRTVDHDTCTVASSARTVAPTTSIHASSAASVWHSTQFVVAPATVTGATDSVTVTTSTVWDAGLAHARFNHGLACGPTSHTESITYDILGKYSPTRTGSTGTLCTPEVPE